MDIIAQFITTILGILASVAIAYGTFHYESKKTAQEQKRIREINQRSVLNLFQASIANMLLFLPECNTDFSKETLSLCCKKIEAIEQQLTDLTDYDLPDYFIEQFQYNRYRLTDIRLSAESIISNAYCNPLPEDIFEDLEVEKLIHSFREFISSYSKKPE